MVQEVRGGKAALICGSVAYDTILVFPDQFKTHILPDKIHILNVAFLVPEMRREYGGCAANIAYGLTLLGDTALPMATAGHDFGPYRERMVSKGISVEHIKVIDEAFTAQAFITTDLDDNQITAFHPGAMQYAHLNKVADVRAKVGLGIVAPDGRQAMIEHAAQFESAGIPFIFDPGQGLPMFSGEELGQFIERATWMAVNDYEWGLVQQKTGLTQADHRQGAGLGGDPGRRGLGDLHPGSNLDHPLRQTQGRGRSDGLRGRLPRWFNPWTAARSRLGNHRPPGLPDGGDQDRIARTAESRNSRVPNCCGATLIILAKYLKGSDT